MVFMCTAPAAAETKPDTSGPPVVEAIETLPSLDLPLVIEEAVPTEIAKELLVAAPAQGEQEAVSTDTAVEPTVAPPSSPPAVEPAPTPDVGVAIKYVQWKFGCQALHALVCKPRTLLWGTQP